MKDWLIIHIVMIVGILGTISCVGDGIGLNEYGDVFSEIDTLVIENSDTLLTALEEIEAKIFGAVCSVECHRPPTPKKGLNLEPGYAYANLVNVSSVEIPTMMRVLPYDAENSYIIWKLEGRSGISGSQMPLNLIPLPDSTIQLIYDWINDGAQP